MAMNYTTAGNLIADYLIAEMDAAPSGADETKMRNGCIAIARGLIEHLATAADVRITTGMAGLQRDPASGDPTLAPTVAVVLAGALE
jgi:hypothetical protein